MQVTPRVYQEIAIKAALKGLRRSSRALVVLATGLGKTLTAAFLAKKLKARKILFLVHNNFILDHAQNEFRLVFDEETIMATYNGMSRKDGAQKADIVFSTWQTMGRNLKKWTRNHFDLIIVDEAHHSEADTYKPVLEYFTAPKLGTTATPDREDKADIRSVFGPEVINITLEEAIARGWLPRIEYHVITDESLDDSALQKIAEEIREAKRRFTMAEVNRRIFIKKRDDEIARIINGYNEKTVVFCASITHAEGMAKVLKLSSAFHSEKGKGQRDTWKKNQATLEALKNGLIRRVCAVNAFNEGVNVPTVGLVAFCRVTGVLSLFRQQLGRGLRPGKDKLIVLDFVGNLERIQLVLEMMNKVSDLHEQFTPKREIEREGYSRERFEVSGKGFEFTFSDKVVDLMKVLEHCERDFYPTWEEASEAVKKLNIVSGPKYDHQYIIDDRLPPDPETYYSNFPGWKIFTGTRKEKPYRTWHEASKASRDLKISTALEYQKRYREDPRLPADPLSSYKDCKKWSTFLGKRAKSDFYTTWKDALKVCQKNNVSSTKEYLALRKKDPRLPGSPYTFYKDFPGLKGSSLSKVVADPYLTWQLASKSCAKLGITSSVQYRIRYKEDPKLPSTPNVRYKNWPGWPKFFGKK